MRVALTAGSRSAAVAQGRFYGRGDDVRRDVVAKLRSAFGETRVRECGFSWRGVSMSMKVGVSKKN